MNANLLSLAEVHFGCHGTSPGSCELSLPPLPDTWAGGTLFAVRCRKSGRNVRMLTLQSHAYSLHLAVNRLESFFEEASSMYSITAEKSRSPCVLSASVFTWSAAEAAGIGASTSPATCRISRKSLFISGSGNCGL